jgi:uncharacterized coiled-coil DUF342 family protein
MDFDPDKMRARFHELGKKRETIRGKADPIREKRDKLAQKHEREIAKANAEVRAAEKGLFEIDTERAMLARALKGQMGEPE